MLLFNARTQQREEVTWSLDSNGEFVATFADGRTLKFPAGSTPEDLEQLAAQHEQSNIGHEVITPELEAARAAERQAAQAVVDQLNGKQSQPEEGDQTNAPISTRQPIV